jgi:hypothetical protein
MSFPCSVLTAIAEAANGTARKSNENPLGNQRSNCRSRKGYERRWTMNSDAIRKESADRRFSIAGQDAKGVLLELSFLHAMYEIAAQLAELNQNIQNKQLTAEVNLYESAAERMNCE